MEVFIRVILYLSRPWFWFYRNFVQSIRRDEVDVKTIGEEWDNVEDDPYVHHVIIDGTDHHSFNSIAALKRFVRDYDRRT